ncbi:hypothetical protein BLNAU_12797 [Blattamonas nauphoetae]|uniref:Uncharacterized protein n=1 Tax=Blattamonas nauphoetae TaxID=2049346 RepID=A0ABQ9XII8_9EUKA|nr:hypothetical protein BLNAU_12797 [Blattamonas nauphoetae]
MFRSQLGTTLLHSISNLLQNTLPLHHKHLSIRDDIAFFGESSRDKSTELCLKTLVLLVEGSDHLKLTKHFVLFLGPLLRHSSTDIVLLVLRTLHTMISNDDFARTMSQKILVVRIDGNTRSVQMMTLVTELFGDHLSRLRTQPGQIQLLWTNGSGSAIQLYSDPHIRGADASDFLDVLTLISQISATSDVFGDLLQLFDCCLLRETTA